MFNLTAKPVYFDVDRFFSDFWDAPLSGRVRTEGSMQVNIKENDDSFEVIALLPGVAKDEISLDVEKDILTISVKKEEDSKEESENYLRREHRSYNMSRSFKLGKVDKDAITAKLDQGVLTLILPKKEPEKPEVKKISIE